MFRLAQISDTHLSAAKPFFIANFEQGCAEIRRRGADLVVNSGDITLNGADEEGDFLAARELHDAIGLPWRAIPGNHDVGDSADVMASVSHDPQPIDPARLARYRSHFGPDCWLEDIPGWRLLGINAQLLGSGLEEEAAQARAIAAWSEEAGHRRIALFLHKPLFDRDPDEDRLGGRFVHPAPRHRLLALLAARPPALVASGHVHQFRRLDLAGARHVWAPSTGYVLPDRIQPLYGVRDIGYVEHRLYPDGRHESAHVRPAAARTLLIADFPQAYGASWLTGPSGPENRP